MNTPPVLFLAVGRFDVPDPDFAQDYAVCDNEWGALQKLREQNHARLTKMVETKVIRYHRAPTGHAQMPDGSEF